MFLCAWTNFLRWAGFQRDLNSLCETNRRNLVGWNTRERISVTIDNEPGLIRDEAFDDQHGRSGS
jgi:hypothetical protein